MKKTLVEIALHEYFAQNYDTIIQDMDWIEGEYWKRVVENFALSDTYKLLEYNASCEISSLKEKTALAQAYLDYLQVFNSYTIMKYCQILDKLVLNDKSDATVASYRRDYDINQSFDLLNPNYPNPIYLSDLFYDTNKNVSKIFEILRKDTKYFAKKIRQESDDAQIYKWDFENLFAKGWTIKVLKMLEDGFEEAYQRQLEAQDDEKYEDDDDLVKEADKAKAKILTTLERERKGPYIMSMQHQNAEDCVERNFANMVGLLKEKNEVLNFIKMIQKNPNVPFSLNFVITGNPGVGKTTFVKCLGKTFYDMGIIKSDKFIEMNGAAIKAKYVGQTIPKVQETFNDGKNGTIFLDEAYTLFQKSGEDSFASEALAEIMTQVENIYRNQEKCPQDRTFVAMAGYKKQMEELIQHNPGAARRFPNNIDLKDYTTAELFEIFKMSVDKYGYDLARDDLKKVFDNFIEAKRKQDNFSNAGLVRNMFQGVLKLQAGRTSLDDKTISAEDLRSYVLQDIEENKGKYTKIGFGTSLEV